MQSFFFSDIYSDTFSDKYLNLTWFLLTSIFHQNEANPRNSPVSVGSFHFTEWDWLNKFGILSITTHEKTTFKTSSDNFPTKLLAYCLKLWYNEFRTYFRRSLILLRFRMKNVLSVEAGACHSCFICFCLRTVGRHDIMNLSEEERLLLFNCNIQFSKALFFSSLEGMYPTNILPAVPGGFGRELVFHAKKEFLKASCLSHGAFCLRELFLRGKILT